MDDKPGKMINIWAELVANWRARNQAQTELYRAKTNLGITFERLTKLCGGRLPEQMVVLDGEATYIVSIDTEEYKLIDIMCADRRTVNPWRNNETG